MSYASLRSLLFRLDPETAHDRVGDAFAFAQRSGIARRWMRRKFAFHDPRLEIEVAGLRFANPLGMAAGFDKRARLVPGLAALGFGAIEVGTVTPLPQEGNPRPRMWRHSEDESLQNALGFNGPGMDVVSETLRSLGDYPAVVGVNLGKNKVTPQSRALDDYAKLIERLATQADYLVVNISSPNTPNLRDLQTSDFVAAVLEMARQTTEVPVFVKLSPDLNLEEAVDLAEAATDSGAAGIIATNTTTDYTTVRRAEKVGGLSGRAVRERSRAMLRFLARRLADRTVLISVGGVDSAEEAYSRLKAGASLVQLYTAFVYAGPGLAGEINRGLVELMERDGFESLSEVVGVDLSER